MATTSLSLLRRAADDESESWNRLVDLYQPLLRRWVSAFQIQPADAEDLVQDVLATVAVDLPAFRHNRRAGAFRTWLRRILTNRARNWLRSRQNRPLVTGTSSFHEQLEQLADDQSELSRLWDQEHNEHVIRRLTKAVERRFEPKTWRAFCRLVLDAASPHEVAAELNMSLSSVYVAKSRVLSALRQEAEGLVD